MGYVLFGLSAFLVGVLGILAWGGWSGWRLRTDPLLYAAGLTVAAVGVIGLLVTPLAWIVVAVGLAVALAGIQWRFELIRLEDSIQTAGRAAVLLWIEPIPPKPPVQQEADAKAAKAAKTLD